MNTETFMNRVMRLDNGDRAALKHSAGKMLNEAGAKAFTAFYKAYPETGLREQEENILFFAACLQCMWKPEELSAKRRLEEEFLRYQAENTDSQLYVSRMKGLLSAKWTEDGYLAGKLLRIVKIAKSKGCVVDCASLAEDLLSWNRNDKTVQKKWLRAIYNSEISESKND